MSRRDAAQVLAMVAWVRQKLTAIQKEANTRVDVVYAGEALHASVGDQVISNTVRVQHGPKIRFDEDPVRFAEWVQQRWPTEIVPSVRESFLDVLKDRMLATDGEVLADDAGEICQWVEIEHPDPYTRTSLNKNANEALAPLLEKRSMTDLLAFIEDEPVDLDKEAS